MSETLAENTNHHGLSRACWLGQNSGVQKSDESVHDYYSQLQPFCKENSSLPVVAKSTQAAFNTMGSTENFPSW